MIELKHLRTLQALRHTGSLAAAAAQLHQTQSALSHQFSDLEQRLGFRLFDLEDELADVFDRPVDLVARRAVNKYIREQVLADARPLYAA